MARAVEVEIERAAGALRPIIVIKEGTGGLGMQFRLVAGPLNDAGTAAKICAVLTENKRTCETAIFDGQRLSLDPTTAAGRGQSPRRASAASPSGRRRRRGAAKKPETSSTTTHVLFQQKEAQ